MSTVGQVSRFAAVGMLSTALHLGLFLCLRWGGMGSAQLANVAALVLATVANTALNRRWTFGVRERAGAARHQVQGLILLLTNLALTSGSLALLHLVAPRPGARAQTAAIATANVLATLLRFAAMRGWMFRARATAPACGREAMPGSREDRARSRAETAGRPRPDAGGDLATVTSLHGTPAGSPSPGGAQAGRRART